MPKRATKSLAIHFPETLEEAEARQFARNFRDSLLRDPHFFDSARASEWVGRLLRAEFESNPLGSARVAEYATLGSDLADRVLRELIAERTEHGMPLGAVLAAYNIRLMNSETAAPRRRHGPSRLDNFASDIALAVLVLRLIEEFPWLRATRFKITRPSACSIASEIWAEAGLHRGSEKAVQAIWGRYGKAIMNGYQWPFREQKTLSA